MPRFAYIVLAVISAMVLTSCSHDGNRAASTSNVPPVIEPMDDQYEVAPPRDTTPKVMQAKLAHAQAILEGLALADYPQIESNAMALKRISQGGDWLAQDSATYFEFSGEFRSICDDIANHARGQNLNAVASDYGNLAASCVACHGYLRHERQAKDIPGRVSSRLRFE